MEVVGIPLGLLMGVISGIVMLLLLRTAYRATFKQLPVITAEILAIPTFWFGGPWLTTTLMQNVDPAELLPPYVLSLAVTFTLIALWPLTRLAIRLGNDIGQAEGGANA